MRRANEPSGDRAYSPWSSATCQRGTNGCEIDHEIADAARARWKRRSLDAAAIADRLLAETPPKR